MKLLILIVIIISSIISCVTLYIGIQHNAMGEFCIDGIRSNCKLDIMYASGIWLSWFIVTLIAQVVVLIVIKGLITGVKMLTNR